MKIIKQEAHLLDTTGMSQYQVIEKAGLVSMLSVTSGHSITGTRNGLMVNG